MIKEKSFEFDAFGPWVYEIGVRHTLPPLFKSYSEDLKDSLMTIKIPRGIERRNANPEMHLYDAVVGVFDLYILVLRRNGSDVESSRIQICEIDFIRETQCLLKGTLEIFTRKEKIEIGYNTVSSIVIAKLVTIIREKQDLKPKQLKLKKYDYMNCPIDTLYKNIVCCMRNHDVNIGLIAYQPKLKLAKKKSIIKLILNKLSGKSVHSSSAFVINNKELIIIDRSEHIEDAERSYSYTFTYLPISSIGRVDIYMEEEMEEHGRVNFEVRGHLISFSINQECIGIDDLALELG